MDCNSLTFIKLIVNNANVLLWYNKCKLIFYVIFAFNHEIKNKERLQLKFNTTASVVRRKQLLMEARDASMIYIYPRTDDHNIITI